MTSRKLAWSSLPIIAALLFASSSPEAFAESASFPQISLVDLDGATHLIPKDWSGGGVLILGFAHDARGDMDQWRDALQLGQSDHWVEAPVIGDVSALIRPMIKGGMKRKYAAGARQHITPVFEGADGIRKTVGAASSEVIVLIVDGNGAVHDRAEGKLDKAAAARLRQTYERLLRASEG